MHQNITVKVLRTVQEIEQLRPAWESWPGHRDSDLDYYLTLLHSKREAIRPHVIAIYSGDALDAVLAGRIDRCRMHLRVGYIPIRPHSQTMVFVYGAMRGNSSIENQKRFINEICRSLSEGEADVAYLNYLRLDSRIYELAKELPGFFRRDHFCLDEPHFSASLPNNVDQFYRLRSRKVRRNRKLYATRMEKGFGNAVEIRCFRHAHEVAQLIAEAEQIAKKTYQRGIGVGFADTPVTRTTMQLSAEKDRLRGYMLYLENRPAAFLIGDLYEGTFFCDYMGYDPAFRQFTPGMYLTTQVLEGFCTEGVVNVDFGRGAAQYKEMIGNHQWDEAAVYIFAETLKGLELNLIKGLTSGINTILKHVLGKTSLIKKVRKTWRIHAIPEQPI